MMKRYIPITLNEFLSEAANNRTSSNVNVVISDFLNQNVNSINAAMLKNFLIHINPILDAISSKTSNSLIATINPATDNLNVYIDTRGGILRNAKVIIGDDSPVITNGLVFFNKYSKAKNINDLIS